MNCHIIKWKYGDYSAYWCSDYDNQMYIGLSCIVVRAEDSELKDLLIKGKWAQSCFSIIIISVH